ncbi:unnamed protein product, partial [Rhizoctonia solani]
MRLAKRTVGRNEREIVRASSACNAVKLLPCQLVSILSAKTDRFKEILARSGSQEIKDLVKAESAALVKDCGAFGFLWIIVRRADGTTTSFFGSDRFANMAW